MELDYLHKNKKSIDDHYRVNDGKIQKCSNGFRALQMSSERCFLSSADEIMQFVHLNMIRQGVLQRCVKEGDHDATKTLASIGTKNFYSLIGWRRVRRVERSRPRLDSSPSKRDISDFLYRRVAPPFICCRN